MNASLAVIGLTVAGVVAGCQPIVVMTSDDPGPRKLELDEAHVRCSGGDSCACHALGVFQANQGDGAAARVSMERGCNLGCVPGCAELSENYFEGHAGQPRDVALGTRFAIRACKLDPARCASPGERFESGVAVPRDPERARLFYAEGCKRGVQQACAGLDRVRKQ